MGVYGVQRDFSAIDVVPEMMELDVDVLGPRAHLRDFGNLECAAVVLKDTAMRSNGKMGRLLLSPSPSLPLTTLPPAQFMPEKMT